MAARLGIFLGWIFTSVALALAALGAWLVYRHPAAPMTDAEFLFVWLLGRGVRFVLAGQRHNANYIGDFVEKFADPRIPIRKPLTASRQPGPWGPRS